MPKPSLQFDLPAILVRTSGIIALLSIPIKTLSDDIYAILPFNPYHLAHITALLTGLSLIYLASQLHRKKRNALLATSAMLSFLILVEAIRLNHPHLILFYAISLAYLLYQRRQYVVNNDITGFRRNMLIGSFLLASVLIYSFVTIEKIDQRDYGRDLAVSQVLSITGNAMLGEPLPAYIHPQRRDRELLFSLQAAFVISSVIVVTGLFYPIRLRRGPSSRVRNRARELLVAHSNSSEDSLKLWPEDKHYYFYNDSFLAYGISRGVAVVIDGAAGNPEHYEGLRKNFIAECRINGWTLSVIHANEAEKKAWEAYGFSNLYLGSEARVDVAEFCKAKIRNKHFRYIRNKAEKDGLSVQELPRPITSEILDQLEQVSNSWLNSGRREYRFIMGYFDREYVSNCRVFAVYKNDKIVAYTNLLPTFQDEHLSIDHLRFISEVSPSAMHYLLMNVVSLLNEATVTTLNLGLSPLSKIEENTDTLAKNLLSTVRRLSGRYYSFAGLEQFKNKFGPEWEPTFLLYYGLPSKLPVLGTALSSISTYKRSSSKLPNLLVGVTVVAALAYASFPLALILNPGYFWRDFASVLGQMGQPYATLFNSLDILSSSLVTLICMYLLLRARTLPRLLKYALLLLIVSALGDLLAAIYILPPGFRVVYNFTLFQNFDVAIHALASFVNGAGYILSVGCWAVWARSRHSNAKRQYLAVAILLISVVYVLFGQLSPELGGTIQRLFICLYAVWLVWFIYDATNTKDA